MSKGPRLTREQVHTAALGVFSSKGYGGGSMADIASALGIAKGSLYNWTDSKESLLAAAVAPYMVALRQLAAGLSGGLSDDPTAVLRRFAVCLHEHRRIVEFVYRDVSVLNTTAVGAELNRLGRQVVEALAGPLPNAHLEPVTVALGAMAQAFCALDPPTPALHEVLIQAAVAGIAVFRAEHSVIT